MGRRFAIWFNEINDVRELQAMLKKERNPQMIEAIKAEIKARQNKQLKP